jgi:mannose-6-phosphate isomerase-like protein (cupin superfamily)
MPGGGVGGIVLAGTGEGESLGVVGDVITVKLDRAATNGAYSAFEELTDPGGGPPPHRHEQSEMFYVLEGEVDFLEFSDSGGEPVNVVRGGPGAVVSIPANAVHTFRNAGSTRSRLFFVCQPSGLEDFFRAIGIPVEDPDNPPQPEGPPDVAFILEAGRKHGITFVGVEP